MRISLERPLAALLSAAVVMAGWNLTLAMPGTFASPAAVATAAV